MLLDITKIKNKLLISGVALVLATPVIFATIAIAWKITVIMSAAIVTYLALSIIQKILAKKNDNGVAKVAADTAKDDTDAGYGTEDEEDMVISAEKQEKAELQKQEELINKREQGRMDDRSLGGPINALGESINNEPSNEIPVKIVMKLLPTHMDALGNQLPDEVIRTENSHLVLGNQRPKQDSDVSIESLPLRMDALGNSLSTEQPSTSISMESEPKRKLSPAELLSRWQGEDNKAFTKQHENLLKMY